MNRQCEVCARADCVGKRSADKVCQRCLHDNRKERLKTCIKCGSICQFADKRQTNPKGDRCVLCGSRKNLEEHHLMRGQNRAVAEQYGYKIRVCHHCHDFIHQNSELEKRLRIKAEREHVAKFGEADLIDKFGQSHL